MPWHFNVAGLQLHRAHAGRGWLRAGKGRRTGRQRINPPCVCTTQVLEHSIKHSSPLLFICCYLNCFGTPTGPM